ADPGAAPTVRVPAGPSAGSAVPPPDGAGCMWLAVGDRSSTGTNLPVEGGAEVNHGMGDDIASGTYTREQRLLYRQKVRHCLDVFERMLAEHAFDVDVPLTGLEIELNLVDGTWQPDMANQRVLDAIADPTYQTE